MRDFPKASIEQARNVAEMYKLRSVRKGGVARRLYDGEFLHFNYGFRDALKHGVGATYLHEIEKEAECFSAAAANYLVAREAGLRPTFYLAHGMRQTTEGDEGRGGSTSHSFISVQLRPGQEIILDPSYGTRGKMFHEPGALRIHSDIERGEIIRREYAALDVLSQEELLDRMEAARTPEGTREVLTVTQKIRGQKGTPVKLTYLPERDAIRTSISFSSASWASEEIEKGMAVDLITPVGQGGRLSPREGEVELYYLYGTGWETHDSPQEPFRFRYKDIEDFSLFVNALNGKSGTVLKDSRHHSRDHLDLIERGFWTDVTIQEGSRLERTIEELGLHEARENLHLWSRGISEDLVARLNQNDETSLRSFLREAYVMKKRLGARTSENPLGFVYSEEDHDQFLLDTYHAHEQSVIEMTNAHLEEMRILAGIEEGATFTAERNSRRKFRESRRRAEDFEVIRGHAKKKQDRDVFRNEVDIRLLELEYDFAHAALPRLQSLVTEEDLIRGAQNRLIGNLMLVGSRMSALLIKPHRKQLEKILAA